MPPSPPPSPPPVVRTEVDSCYANVGGHINPANPFYKTEAEMYDECNLYYQVVDGVQEPCFLMCGVIHQNRRRCQYHDNEHRDDASRHACYPDNHCFAYPDDTQACVPLDCTVSADYCGSVCSSYHVYWYADAACDSCRAECCQEQCDRDGTLATGCATLDDDLPPRVGAREGGGRRVQQSERDACAVMRKGVHGGVDTL